MERLKTEIAQVGGTADISDLQRYLQFYLMDLVKDAVLACLQKHQKEIGDILSGSAKVISGEISQAFFGGIQTQIADCIADISWTNVDTTMFAGDVILSMSQLSSVIGPFYVVGQAIAGAIRQKVVAHNKEDMIKPILQNYNSILNGVIDNLNAIYAQINKSALSKLDELYQNQVETSKETIEHAQKIAADESVKVNEVLESLEEALQTVNKSLKLLKEYD
jgi:hypothetical protein